MKETKSFPASLSHLYEMLEFIKVPHHNLVLEEALVNIIRYAYPDKQGTVSITKDGTLVVLEDEGIPFNPLTEKTDTDGYGTLLIKEMTKDVLYKRENGKNVLVLRL